MSSKKVEKAIIAFMRKRGDGRYEPTKRDVVKDLLRITAAKNVKYDEMDACIQKLLKAGKLKPIKRQGRLVGLKLAA